MYLQITTRCNMKCEHCGMNCTNKGEDMTKETFLNAIEKLHDEWTEDSIQLGGGEPTIHPLFWEFMGLSLCEGEVWLATNGSITKTALKLCKMARKGIIYCVLSMDDYHDPIDWEVVDAFQDGMKRKPYSNNNSFMPIQDGDRREIRDNSNSIINHGRALENGIGIKEGCICNSLFVKPNGDVKQCGCDSAPVLGNVNDPDFEIEYMNDGYCYTEMMEVLAYE